MLTRDNLYSLETYASVRKEFRAKVIAHKKMRLVELGAHASIHFEDRLTMQYQVQEMLRLERIFEPELIQEELDVYNPLIPDGSNWKATLMFEYPDDEERRRRSPASSASRQAPMSRSPTSPALRPSPTRISTGRRRRRLRRCTSCASS